MGFAKLQTLSSAAAIALLATVGTAAAAPIITVLDSGPIPFATLNLGTAVSAGFQNSTTIVNPGFDNIASIVFAGGSPTLSGVYAGSTGTAASPFPLGSSGNSLTNYLVAEPGGTVTINFSTPQTTLDLLWGTVDSATGYNVVTGGGNMITGAQILALAPGSPSSGSTNTAVEITGLNPFTSLVFSDTTPNPPAFEFDIGAPVPEPASLTIFGTALAGLGLIRRRRRSL